MSDCNRHVNETWIVAFAAVVFGLFFSLLIGIKGCELRYGDLGDQCFMNNTCNSKLICHRPEGGRGVCVPEKPQTSPSVPQ